MACFWNSIVMNRLEPHGDVFYGDSSNFRAQGENLNTTIFSMESDTMIPYFQDQEENITVSLQTVARIIGISIEYYVRNPSEARMEHLIQGRAGVVNDKYYQDVAIETQRSDYTNAVFDGDFNSPEFSQFLEDITGLLTQKQKETITMGWIMEHCRGEGFPVGGFDEEFMDDLELYNYRR